MSTEIIKLTNPKDKLIVTKEFMEQFNAALATCEEIGAEFKHELKYVEGLIVTEENIQAIKKERTAHNAAFQEYDDQRKVIKGALNAPYDTFNKAYKENVGDIHKDIDAAYKRKIAEYEDKLIAQKTEEVKAYYDEYLAASGIVENYGKFFNFETIGLKINLSASENKLREEVEAFIDRIGDDLALIKTQEHADEILYDYKRVGGSSYLSASTAIRSIDEKYKTIEAEKARAAERQARQQAQKEAEKKVEDAVPIPEPLEAPKPLSSPAPSEKIVTVKFTVKATMSKMKALKQFLIDGGYDYE
jgi:RNase H-fold protein (predicted Holliday junction resolvase)